MSYRAHQDPLPFSFLGHGKLGWGLLAGLCALQPQKKKPAAEGRRAGHPKTQQNPAERSCCL